MNTGFVPALGTPLDENGQLVERSYARQIQRMLDAGAVGLLSMGSMGQQAFLQPDVCVRAATTAVKTAAGRVPVYVGAMDNSILRAKARIASMEELDLTAFVFTTPYYEVDNVGQVLKYYRSVAEATRHSIILYDLPGVTNFKITYDMVCALHQDVKNLLGIKSADLQMLRKIRLNPDLANLRVFYSGLDTFDIAYPWGVGNILDGMLTCTPVNTEKMVSALNAGDRATAAKHLSNIVAFRDFLNERDLWPSYSAAMNLLGFDGMHGPDWCTAVSAQTISEIRGFMTRIGELADSGSAK